tara:strand:+ start:576 stop:1646 length:1071 start_codon:yes stop_codon:yes gene_type:complete
MAISNFFTAFYSALSDPAAYYSFQKEMNTKAVEDLYLNTFKGKFSFEAVVLAVLPQSVDSTTAQQSIRVRPLELHDLFLPEPCNKFFDFVPGAREAIISMHPVAYSKEAPTRLTVNNGESKILGMSIRPGDIVKCYFVVGPSDQGKLRGLTFEPMTRGSLPRSNMNLRCLTSIATQGAAAMFGGGGYEPVNEYQRVAKRFEIDLENKILSLGLPFHVTSRTRTVDQQMAAIMTKYTKNGRDEIVKTYRDRGEKMVVAIESNNTTEFRKLASESSKHLKGAAIDIRTKHYSGEQVNIVLKVIKELGGRSVLEPINNCWEDSGTNVTQTKRKSNNKKRGEGNCYGEHIHIDVPKNYGK